MNELTNRNLGKFEVSLELIKRNPEDVSKVFSMLKILPVRCDTKIYMDTIEYIGISKHFDEVPMGEKIPEYELVIETSENNDLYARVEKI